MSDGLGGVVDANHLLVLSVVVGLLATGGGPSGGVSRNGAGDMAVACHLTLGSALVSLGRGSLGGCGLWVSFFFWALVMVLIQRGESSFPSSLFIFSPFGASLMPSLSSPVVLLLCPHYPTLSCGWLAGMFGYCTSLEGCQSAGHFVLLYSSC